MENHTPDHPHDHEQHAPGAHHPAPPRPAGAAAWLLPASILVAAVLIGGSLIYTVHGRPAATAPVPGEAAPGVAVEAPSPAERDVILGDPGAPVSIIAFEDFQCPFCAQYFEETESAIRTAYVETGKAKMVYRHLAFLGPESVAAAAASECAKDQGKFWEYHDELFRAESADGVEHNGNLARPLFMQIAKGLKLDEAKFGSCIDGNTHVAFVEKATQEAGDLYGVQSTPTIFVNDQKVEGAYPFATFQQLIESFL